MLSAIDRNRLKKAFRSGTLKTASVSPDGNLEWKKIAHVQRAEVLWETIYEVRTDFGADCLTAGHRVFVAPTEKRETQVLTPGDSVLGVSPSGDVFNPVLTETKEAGRRQFMYDLTVEDWHNFVLCNSRIVVSNCPDKFYHFRPPEWEGDIGQYNRIFGQIWEDAELLEYIERSLDWFNMFPPLTQKINTVDLLVTDMPAWRTAILWGAIAHACFALAANWVADEFDYSIGGVSLTIEKSSKYESLKQNAESMFDKATEAKVRTVKFIRGLQQPRFGLGVRSAFGPYVAKGVLSPRSFV